MKNSTVMEQWSERTAAVADLLNPALIATVIATSASHYKSRGRSAMPFELSFLVVPLVLHRDTRGALPLRVNSHLSKWVASHEVLAAGFGARAKALVEPVREGLRFGIRCGAIELGEGNIVGHLRSRTPAAIGDVGEIVTKAGFLGRWFTRIESPATAFALLGVEV